MATVEEEFQKHRASGKRPIAGQSLANDPENPAPYEKAPEFTSVHKASEYLWESFIEPKTYVNLMQAVDDGVPVMNLVQVVLFAEFQEGAWNPDLMLMLVEPAAYMIIALAERLDLDIVIDTDLLTQRSGEAFKKYALNFKDKSGKEISLRPDLTIATSIQYIQSKKKGTKKLSYFGGENSHKSSIRHEPHLGLRATQV